MMLQCMHQQYMDVRQNEVIGGGNCLNVWSAGAQAQRGADAWTGMPSGSVSMPAVPLAAGAVGVDGKP